MDRHQRGTPAPTRTASQKQYAIRTRSHTDLRNRPARPDKGEGTPVPLVLATPHIARKLGSGRGTNAFIALEENSEEEEENSVEEEVEEEEEEGEEEEEIRGGRFAYAQPTKPSRGTAPRATATATATAATTLHSKTAAAAAAVGTGTGAGAGTTTTRGVNIDRASRSIQSQIQSPVLQAVLDELAAWETQAKENMSALDDENCRLRRQLEESGEAWKKEKRMLLGIIAEIQMRVDKVERRVGQLEGEAVAATTTTTTTTTARGNRLTDDWVPAPVSVRSSPPAAASPAFVSAADKVAQELGMPVWEALADDLKAGMCRRCRARGHLARTCTVGNKEVRSVAKANLVRELALRELDSEEDVVGTRNGDSKVAKARNRRTRRTHLQGRQQEEVANEPPPSDRNRMQRTGGSSGLEVALSLTQKPRQGSIHARALVATGSSVSFIDREFVRVHRLATRKLRHPPRVDTSLGSEGATGSATHCADVELEVKPGHVERIALTVYDLDGGSTPILLGYDWLVRHNPRIGWAEGTVELENCKPGCCDERDERESEMRSVIRLGGIRFEEDDRMFLASV